VLTVNVTPWEIKEKIVTKVDVETDPKYGCEPSSREINEYLRYGVINLDKPPGPSSHEVVAWVKKIIRLKHAGHGGTLEA
jgi:H/ACA ribonucleoprotein complex subunit 4